jgi:hypothetical protein
MGIGFCWCGCPRVPLRQRWPVITTLLGTWITPASFGSWDGEGKAEMRCWIREIALCFPGLDVGHGPVNVVDAGSSSVRMDALA